MKPVVLFLETVDPTALELLNPVDCDVVLPGAEYDGTRVRAIITRGKGRVDRALLDSLPNLKAVVRCGVGVNNIDVDYATERGVRVLNVPGVNAATVAEHTIGLMLMSVRGLYRLVREVKQGNWNYRTHYAGGELRGLTLGIIGMGNIGGRVGAVAGAMGMEVIYTNPQPSEEDVRYRPLPKLLAQSDVVSLHTPLTDQTRGMMGTERLAEMKAGAHLINTARGEIVDGPALLAALESGHLAGYASDLMVEGDADTHDRVLARPEVLITPHAASLTALTYREMSEQAVQHVVDVLEGREVDGRYRVNG